MQLGTQSSAWALHTAAACVQSPWYHRWACSTHTHTHACTHLSSFQRRDLHWLFNNTACYCPGGSLLCVSELRNLFFSSNLLRSLPKHAACSVQGRQAADAATLRDDFGSQWERERETECDVESGRTACWISNISNDDTFSINVHQRAAQRQFNPLPPKKIIKKQVQINSNHVRIKF